MTVFLLAKPESRIVHIEREHGTAWCGARCRARTVSDRVTVNLCPKCKTAHADAFGLANVQRKGKR